MAIIKGDATLAFGIIPSEKVRCDFGEVLRVRSAANEFATAVVREGDAIRVRVIRKIDDHFVPSGHIIEELQSSDAPLIRALAGLEKAEAELVALREERDAYKASSDLRGENVTRLRAALESIRDYGYPVCPFPTEAQTERKEIYDIVLAAIGPWVAGAAIAADPVPACAPWQIALDAGELAQLEQLVLCTWDGDLISKDHRDALVKAGLAQRAHGWNWLTATGVRALLDSGKLKVSVGPSGITDMQRLDWLERKNCDIEFVPFDTEEHPDGGFRIIPDAGGEFFGGDIREAIDKAIVEKGAVS